MRIVPFFNEKGGTSKTTFAVNLAAFISMKRKKRILLIDLDSQGHAGKSLGVAVREAKITAFEFLTRKNFDPQAAILPTHIKNLDIICANKRMADFSLSAARMPDRALRLKKALARLNGYDCIFIDSPPSVGLVTTNILVAATDVVIPVALTYLALDGCAEVIQSITNIREKYPEAKPELAMIIPTFYRQTKLANEIVSKIAEHFPAKISKTILGFNVRIDEAQSFGKTIWEYEPNGRGARMLGALAVELYNRILKPK